MEKVLRRSILNRNQLVSKKRRESTKDLRTAWREYNRTKNLQATALNRLIRSERITRREDWMLGPLAPQRDVGRNTWTYGAVGNLMGQTPKLPVREMRGPRGKGYDAKGSEDKRLPGFENGEWSGEGLHGNIIVGDRVVVVRGRMGLKGKIGEITRVETKSGAIFIKDVNKVDMKVPPQARVGAGGQRIFEQEMPVLIDDVLLVTSLEDPETGVIKDVIVRHLYGGAPWQERPPGTDIPRHTRYIKGLLNTDGTKSDLEIPWPKELPDRSYSQSCDTTRNLVEEVTYIPDVSALPTVRGVIDELRSKHSRQRRDWDDEELLKKKLLLDARRDWFAERSRILSQPFWTKEFLVREKRAAEEKGEKGVKGVKEALEEKRALEERALEEKRALEERALKKRRALREKRRVLHEKRRALGEKRKVLKARWLALKKEILESQEGTGGQDSVGGEKSIESKWRKLDRQSRVMGRHGRWRYRGYAIPYRPS